MSSVTRMAIALVLVMLFVFASGEALAGGKKSGGGGGTSYTNFYGTVYGIDPIEGTSNYNYVTLNAATVSATYRARYGLQLPQWFTDTAQTNAKGEFQLYLSKQNAPGWEVLWPVTVKAYKHNSDNGPWYWTERWTSDKYLPHYFHLPRDRQTFVYDALQFTQTDYASLKYGSGYSIEVTAKAFAAIDPLWGWSMTKDLPWIADKVYTATSGAWTGGLGEDLQARRWFWSTGQFSTDNHGNLVIEGASVYGNQLQNERGFWADDYVAPSAVGAGSDFYVPAGSPQTITDYLRTSLTLNTALCANIVCDQNVFGTAVVPLEVVHKAGNPNVYPVTVTLTPEHWYRYLFEGGMTMHIFCVDSLHVNPTSYPVGGDRGWSPPVPGDWGIPDPEATVPQNYWYINAEYDAAARTEYAECWAMDIAVIVNYYSYSWSTIWAQYTAGVTGTTYVTVPGEYYGVMRNCFAGTGVYVSLRVTNIDHVVLAEYEICDTSWWSWAISEKTRTVGSSFSPTLSWQSTVGETYFIEVYLKVDCTALPYVGWSWTGAHASYDYVSIWNE